MFVYRMFGSAPPYMTKSFRAENYRILENVSPNNRDEVDPCRTSFTREVEC